MVQLLVQNKKPPTRLNHVSGVPIERETRLELATLSLGS